MDLSLLTWRRAVSELYSEVRRLDPEPGHQLWIRGRQRLFREHPASPLPPAARVDGSDLVVAGYDPAYRFESELDPTGAGAALDVPGTSDGVIRLTSVGRVHLGELGSLEVWWLDAYGGGVFVPVKDASAGGTTHGGGRYLLDTVKGADLGGTDRMLVIDLNFAYNPSCAYDSRWACPLAPTTNTLAAAVPVGELMA